MKRIGFSAARSMLAYIRDNADTLYLADSGVLTGSSVTANAIVSSNVSSADFTLASAGANVVMTVGAKNSQTVEGSGNAQHVYLVTISANRLLLVAQVSSQILASGNTVNLAAWTVTAFSSASN